MRDQPLELLTFQQTVALLNHALKLTDDGKSPRTYQDILKAKRAVEQAEEGFALAEDIMRRQIAKSGKLLTELPEFRIVIDLTLDDLNK